VKHKRLVHVVDDDDGVRRSLSFLLRTAGFQVKSWPSGADFLAGIDIADPACILLDACMPPPDGITVLRELSQRGVAFPVIVLTGHVDLAGAIEVLRAGAADFIEKPFERALLLATIGNAFRYMEDPAADRRQEAAVRALAALDDPERLVLEKVAAGWEDDRIAEHLRISLRAVAAQRARLPGRLGLPSVAAALRLVFATKLIDG
jgi:two-component system response regulator FixJ